jgi:transaldolase
MRKFPFKIFIDGGDPVETIQAEQMLGYIDGQTTNPSLVAKNPFVSDRLAKGEKFTLEEINGYYRKIIEEISAVVGISVSIEPYADSETTVSDLVTQAQKMHEWSNKAWIKFPTTAKGLEAAKIVVAQGMRVNMTLCFSQEQAAAVYEVTKGAKEPVFVSPFVGRFDDRGENGMDLIANIIKMFEDSDHHVQVLTASVRSLDHFFMAMRLKSPIITVPFKVFKMWAEKDFLMPGDENVLPPTNLRKIEYQGIVLNKPWTQYNIYHELTDAGLIKFAEDWNKLIGK